MIFTSSSLSYLHFLLCLQLAGNPDRSESGVDPFKTMGVTVADSAGTVVTDLTYQFDTTNTDFNNMGWEIQSFTFTAVDVFSKLTFVGDQDRGARGPALDNVRMYAI